MGSDGKWKADSCDKRYGFVCHIGEVLIALKNGKVSSSGSGESTASNAYDGLISTAVVASHRGHYSWWQAELERKAIITKVHWYPDHERLYNIIGFFTSMDGVNWTPCSTPDSPTVRDSDKSIMVKCNQPQLGKFIQLKRSERVLTFYEVKVYGTLPDDVVRFPRPIRGTESGRPYTQGYVEVRYDGRWGTICDNVFADTQNGAKVVCRMMGYTDGVYAEAYKQKELAAKRKRIVWLDNVKCNGGEDSIFKCDHKPIREHDCRVGDHPHNQDIGVRCFGPVQTEVQLSAIIRGVDSEGRRYKQGVVQFRNSEHNSGNWGYLCQYKKEDETEHNIGKTEADVICRAMGHKSGEYRKYDSSMTYGENPNSFALTALECAAEAKSVDECTMTWNDQEEDSKNCEKGQIGVRCHV